LSSSCFKAAAAAAAGADIFPATVAVSVIEQNIGNLTARSTWISRRTDEKQIKMLHRAALIGLAYVGSGFVASYLGR